MTGLRGRELAQAVVDTVTAHPELHDQDTTVCGTTACLVGWTIALAHDLHPGDDLNVLIREEIGAYQLIGALLASAKEVDIAAELLGLDRNLVADVFVEADEQDAIRDFAAITGARLPEEATLP
jgi:hypothetical protein